MKEKKLLSTCLLAGFLLLGCLSAPEPFPREQIPPSVRDIKNVQLFGHESKKDTGIDVIEGETLSIMAKGTIYLHRNHGGFSAGTAIFVQYIDDQPLGAALTPWPGASLSAPRSGRLYLGIQDSTPNDNHGHFDVTVIAWRDAGHSDMAGFLSTLLAKDPGHRGIKMVRDQALRLKEINTAKAETAQAIEATREQLKEIKQEDPQKADAVPAPADRSVRELEERLADLTAKLRDLDDLGLKLKQESDKAAQLSRQLEEQERRERELMSKLGEGAKVAPLVLIASPEDGLRTEAGSALLSGAAEDDGGLVRLEVLVNGRPAPEAEARGIRPVAGEAPRRMRFERQVPLAPGENRILVRATDSDGLVAERGVTVHHSASRRNVWAVVVGINQYPRLPKLKYAVNDAQAFYRLLTERNRVPAENITLLLDGQATLRNLRSALGTGLKGAAGTGDMVIIFFAGHGATERDSESPDGDGLEKYILTYDSDPADLFSTALPMRDIALILNRIRSERLVFLADSCYSGASGGRTVGTGGIRANISDTFLERLAGGRGKVIITASAANEVSVEKDDLRHGVFTYYLLEGLKGAADADHDGTVTVDEAYRYVSDRVPRATGQEQHPVKKGSVEGSLVLSVTR
jgi:hypothetical protein